MSTRVLTNNFDEVFAIQIAISANLSKIGEDEMHFNTCCVVAHSSSTGVCVFVKSVFLLYTSSPNS